MQLAALFWPRPLHPGTSIASLRDTTLQVPSAKCIVTRWSFAARVTQPSCTAAYLSACCAVRIVLSTFFLIADCKAPRLASLSAN
eukprot:3077297-Karenia_brevis.AAC.1